MARTGWLAITALVYLGCTGRITGSSEHPSGPTGPTGAGGGATEQQPLTTQTPFTCDSSAATTELPLRRLARDEYVNTLHAFINQALPTSGETIYAGLADPLSKVPDDTIAPVAGDRRGGFARLDQTVQQDTVNQTYAVAVAAGAAMTDSSAHLKELLGSCATDADTSNDAACLEAFVSKLGAFAQRHPLAAEDHDFIIETAGNTPVDPAAVADVIALMLTMPGFLYQLESGDAQVADHVFKLDAYELAARLSYQFWQGPPDAALTAAAANGSLLTADGYQTQLDRIFQDGRTGATLDAFFGQWFRLDELGALDTRIGDPVFDAFAGTNVPSNGLKQAMFDEVLDASRYEANHGGSLVDLLTDSKNFARTPELAALYGVTAWDGVSDPAALPAERTGLLTRGAFLATGTANTRPVMKGLRIRNGLLCDAVPPPPNNANAMPLPLSPDDTTRQTLEKLTQQDGTACATCHAVMLNPLGFATENFDALGRFRSAQTLYDQTTGAVLGSKPVDTTSVPRVVLTDTIPSLGIHDVTHDVAVSGKMQTCFARQYFRFTFRRAETDATDGCALRALDTTARSTTLAESLEQAALSAQFKTRRIVY